jgi:hypothetical protein
MPRSHRFEHHTVPEAEADPDLARRDKQELAVQSSAEQGETEIHYGKRFAETEAILKARAEERAAAAAEHERGVPPDQHLGSTEEQVSPTPPPPSTGTVADETGMPAVTGETRPPRRGERGRTGRTAHPDRTPPLGAMPSEELPPAAEQGLAETPAELIGAFRDQVTRSVRGVGEAARQLRSAGREVAGLPLEALRLVLRIGRWWIGRSPRRA